MASVTGEPRVVADEAGLRPGDLILAVNGTRVREVDDIVDVFEPLAAGEMLTLRLRRGVESLTRKVRLIARPAARGRPDAAEVKTPGLAFSSRYEQAMAGASRRGQPVLLVFGTSWCDNSAALRRSLQHASLRTLLARYQRIWIDSDREPALADRYRVESLPHIEVLDSRGGGISRRLGYQPPEALAGLLRGGLAATRETPAPKGGRKVPAPAAPSAAGTR